MHNVMNYQITSLEPADWPAVRAIYAEGITTGNATFETEPPEWEKWESSHRKDCRLVARETGQANAVLGWAALSPVSARRVYAGVAEVSIYIVEVARGKGVGKGLLSALIEQSEEHGIWTLQAGIFPENTASITLHRSCGFREVGRREKIGQLKGVWRDVILLERRSRIIGK